MATPLSGPVTHLKKVAITGMAMDTSKGQYQPLKFPDDHPANALEIREAVSGDTVADFVDIFWETLAGAGRILTSEIKDQIVAATEKMDLDSDPVCRTFVAYECVHILRFSSPILLHFPELLLNLSLRTGMASQLDAARFCWIPRQELQEFIKWE
jgi:hypothetical protein